MSWSTNPKRITAPKIQNTKQSTPLSPLEKSQVCIEVGLQMRNTSERGNPSHFGTLGAGQQASSASTLWLMFVVTDRTLCPQPNLWRRGISNYVEMHDMSPFGALRTPQPGAAVPWRPDGGTWRAPLRGWPPPPPVPRGWPAAGRPTHGSRPPPVPRGNPACDAQWRPHSHLCPKGASVLIQNSPSWAPSPTYPVKCDCDRTVSEKCHCNQHAPAKCWGQT